jgi:hypothetical protein
MIHPNLNGRRRACATNHAHGPRTVTGGILVDEVFASDDEEEEAIDAAAVVAAGKGKHGTAIERLL